MKLKCDWCPKQLQSFTRHTHEKRYFCSAECKQAWLDFRQRIYDPVRPPEQLKLNLEGGK